MDWLLHPLTPFVIIIIATIVLGWRRGYRLWHEWQEFQAWRRNRKHTAAAKQEQVTLDSEAIATAAINLDHELVVIAPSRAPLDGISPPFAIDFDHLPMTAVPGVPKAMLAPPDSLWWSIEHIRARANKPYSFPLGWGINQQGRGSFLFGSFVDDIYDILLTAIKRGGKDNTLMNILLTLMGLNSAEDLQIVLIDGKGGLDYIGWENKAHIWHLAVKPHEVPMAMELVSAEREDRIKWLKENKRSRWEEVKPGQRRPLMLVVVSEIRILTQQVGESTVETWLAEEMSVIGGLGMRIIVATQNSSGSSKEWRSLFEFYMAGTQPSRHEVEPNTGKTIKELREDLGVVPPNELPDVGTAPGVFTLVHGNTAKNVRTTRIDDDQRTYWLNFMPTITSEQQAKRLAHKQRILMNLVLERERVEIEKESLKAGVYYEGLSQPSKAPETQEPNRSENPQNTTGTQSGYDRQALQAILDAKTHDELSKDPLFQRAVAIEYRRLGGSVNAVVKHFWINSKGGGNRHTTVTQALKLIQEREKSNADFITELITA